jgi:hypothetical protein
VVLTACVLAGADCLAGAAADVGAGCVVLAVAAVDIATVVVDVLATLALWCRRLWALCGGSLFVVVELVDVLVEAAAVDVVLEALEPQPATTMAMATAAGKVEISARLMRGSLRLGDLGRSDYKDTRRGSKSVSMTAAGKVSTPMGQRT